MGTTQWAQLQPCRSTLTHRQCRIVHIARSKKWAVNILMLWSAMDLGLQFLALRKARFTLRIVLEKVSPSVARLARRLMARSLRTCLGPSTASWICRTRVQIQRGTRTSVSGTTIHPLKYMSQAMEVSATLQ